MIVVRFLKSWRYPNVLRQSPGGTGDWGPIRLTLEPDGPCDYVAVSTKVDYDYFVRCAPENIWLLLQEPPNEEHKHFHSNTRGYGRVYHQDVAVQSPVHRLSHGALPWHVDKTYDQLMAVGPESGREPLSWITSNSVATAGHRRRMNFLTSLTSRVGVSLWGRGFNPIVDKWDGLAPFNYTLAIENFSSDWYWSEKVADAFLAWCLPIYHGCAKLEEYFPAESFIRVDIDDPGAPKMVADLAKSDEWHKRLDAIAEARRRVLNEHQLFPFLARAINEDAGGRDRPRRWNVVNSAYRPGPRGRLQRATKHAVVKFGGTTALHLMNQPGKPRGTTAPLDRSEHGGIIGGAHV